MTVSDEQPQRVKVQAFGALETVELTARIAAETGAASFEIAYDAADRVLADGEEPGPDDRVRWWATVKYDRGSFRRRRKVIGEYVAPPGSDQSVAGQLACVALLRELGVAVTTIGPAPR